MRILSSLKEMRQGTLHTPEERIPGRGKCKCKGPEVDHWVEVSKTRIAKIAVLGEQ